MSSGLRTSVFQTARILPSHASRLLHQTAVGRHPPYKDDMDRTSLRPKAHENTQSGTDEEAAAEHGDAAFNPRKTAPETERKAAAEGAAQQGKQTSPLDSSPADHTFAKGGEKGTGGGGGGGARPTQGDDGSKKKEKKSSGAGDPPKAGKV